MRADINTLLLVHQSYNQVINRKLNQESLNQAYKQNAELRSLNNQLAETNVIQRKLLEIKIQEVKDVEKLKFLKAISFCLFELVEYLDEIKQINLQQYFFNKYSHSLEDNLIFCKEGLIELQDKIFCKTCLEKIKGIKTTFLTNINYKNSYFEEIDLLFSDLVSLNEKNENLTTPKLLIHFPYNPPKSLLGLNRGAIIKYHENYENYKNATDIENVQITKQFESEKTELIDLISNHNYWYSIKQITQEFPDFFDIDDYIKTIQYKISNIQNVEKTLPEHKDALFEDAARLIVMHQQGSTSLIQRKMKLGYNRAGRIIDQLEAAGIVGPFGGSKARDVLIPDEYALEQFLNNLNDK